MMQSARSMRQQIDRGLHAMATSSRPPVYRHSLCCRVANPPHGEHTAVPSQSRDALAMLQSELQDAVGEAKRVCSLEGDMSRPCMVGDSQHAHRTPRMQYFQRQATDSHAPYRTAHQQRLSANLNAQMFPGLCDMPVTVVSGSLV